MSEKEIKQLQKQVNDQKHEISRLITINNTLKVENEQLKFELKECQEHKLFSRRELERENEQLKSALKELKEIGDYQASRIKELTDENEQLKKQIDNMAFILRQNGLGLMEDDD